MSPRLGACLGLCLAIAAGCGSEEGEAVAGGALAPEAVSPQERIRASTLGVDDARLAAAGSDAANWLTHGRTYAEDRYSPLDLVNAGNVADLRLAWSFPTGLQRGHEATSLVVDGVMYTTGSWSVVFALDATTGKLLWKWDPRVSHEVGRVVCCDVVNRGVALYRGRVYVGVLDGRLAALDAATGELDWEVVTVDQSLPYSITGAPRVVKGRIVIGNGGAELGVRGYVSAYDADTGELAWRTYTVPGNPSEPFESPALEVAAATWTGEEWWKVGGGGTVWDSMSYDPELDLLYVGTGNGSPWSKYIRSPGGGDNLYLSSILALDPDTGELRWHYQTTPGDSWDFTSTQQMILADLRIGGELRRVIMQAPKNGFFYVLDRETGELLSAEPYVEVTWARGVDLETGRPVLSGTAEYDEGIAVVKPTAYGGHNWHSMSYSPLTGLVYIPAQEIFGAYRMDAAYRYKPGEWNTGNDLRHYSILTRELVSGHLLAWDPVAQREVWRHPHGLPWNGGTLATAGNLVFQGTADGRFLALRADDGMLLWQSHHADTGIIAAPVTYRVDGVQYVSVVAGWGGVYALSAGDAAAAAGVESNGKVITYSVQEFSITPEIVEGAMAARDPATVAGNDAYHTYCFKCHGAGAIPGGVLPDVRESASRMGAGFVAVVREGLPGTSMPGFAQWLEDDEIREIAAYLKSRAER
ncbi:MAG: PQQ-dependent dehydrogenase, methanol/ethanol family [Proteobacteria bacterium]|nr:PQQ-dependent dehydrogenase, methanol/ethanol family [Pseudomonadota bacterium]MCZ6784135.1 PQQ-dependent dehydrogenase, methanol/ethanol family [Pseudomonadota bacterium]